MERLTEWDEYGNADIIALSDVMPEIYAELSFSETNDLTDALNCLAAYEDAMALDRVQKLARAEKDGRLVVLPCKVGDKVYRVITTLNAAPIITEIEIKTLGQAADLIGRIGKKQLLVSWYLTREEAEAALKKREEAHEREGV